VTRLLALALAIALGLAGCGFGEGEAQEGGADLRVTKDFGNEQIAAKKIDTVHEDESVMRLLQSGSSPIAAQRTGRCTAAT
jgi:outer membrane lipoprotein SlyB